MAPLPTNHPPMHHSDYPRQLSSFLHRHPLALMIRNPLVPSRRHRICDVCLESIDGDFYQCNDCHFHVHQYCTRLPMSLRHVIDPTHKLRLHKLSSGSCSVCKADCSSLWVYGCHVCKVNIHLKCLRKPFGSPEKPDRPSGSRGIHHHHQAHAPPPWATATPHFHGGFPGGGGPAFPQGYGWGYDHPNNHFGHHGAVQFAHNNHPSHHPNHGGHGHGHAPSSSSLGSVVGSAMFSLVENLAIGALTDFIFGSIGF